MGDPSGSGCGLAFAIRKPWGPGGPGGPVHRIFVEESCFFVFSKATIGIIVKTNKKIQGVPGKPIPKAILDFGQKSARPPPKAIN